MNIARVRSIVGEVQDAMKSIHNELMQEHPHPRYLDEKLKTLEIDVPCLREEINRGIKAIDEKEANK